jgi:hypothetical protein
MLHISFACDDRKRQANAADERPAFVDIQQYLEAITEELIMFQKSADCLCVLQ